MRQKGRSPSFSRHAALPPRPSALPPHTLAMEVDRLITAADGTSPAADEEPKGETEGEGEATATRALSVPASCCALPPALLSSLCKRRCGPR